MEHLIQPILTLLLCVVFSKLGQNWQTFKIRNKFVACGFAEEKWGTGENTIVKIFGRVEE